MSEERALRQFQRLQGIDFLPLFYFNIRDIMRHCDNAGKEVRFTQKNHFLFKMCITISGGQFNLIGNPQAPQPLVVYPFNVLYFHGP